MKQEVTLDEKSAELLAAVAQNEGCSENEALRRALLALAARYLKNKADKAA